MQVITADYLMSQGCSCVDVECHLYDIKPEYNKDGTGNNLIIDVYAISKRLGSIGIETGVGASNGSSPIASNTARTIAKSSRYSPYFDIFGIGLPITYRMPVPECIVEQTNGNAVSEIEYDNMKHITDGIYNKPPFTNGDFSKIHVDMWYFLNIDRKTVMEIDSDDKSLQQYLHLINSSNFDDFFG